MQTPLFILSSPPTVGTPLLGAYAWAAEQWVTAARVQRVGPGALTLTLDRGGVLTDLTVEADVAAKTFPLDLPVPAGAVVRCRITACEADLGGIALTLDLAARWAPPPALTVRWVNGGERFTVFTSDGLFYTAQPLAAGRATITEAAGVWTLTIQGETVLRVGADGTLGTTLIAPPPPAPLGPQLQFCVAEVAVATLTAGGLYVTAANEGVAVTRDGQFTLGDVTLDATGVWALRFEPL